MSIFQVLYRNWLLDVKFSLETSGVNNNGKTPTIFFTWEDIRKKIVLERDEEVVGEIHFPSHAMPFQKSPSFFSHAPK